MVKLLMFRGADRNSKSSGTETVLTRATKNGISDLVRILLEYVSICLIVWSFHIDIPMYPYW